MTTLRVKPNYRDASQRQVALIRARTLSGLYPQAAYNPVMGAVVEYDPQVGSWLSKAVRAVAPAVATVIPGAKAVLETTFPGSTTATSSWNPNATLPNIDSANQQSTDAKQQVFTNTSNNQQAGAAVAKQWINGVPNAVTIGAGVVGVIVLLKLLKD